MKKFINRPENVVEEMLQGLAVLSPGLARLSGHKVMFRADAEQIRDKQVAVISGGGSGHEPAHAGYAGAGMQGALHTLITATARRVARFFFAPFA
jgi:triose/dihydroxyacetone kinase / FAD-AMP lyase (cyclizing)